MSGKPLRPCKYCQLDHMDFNCPTNPNNKNNVKKKSDNPCRHCGLEWHHGHKCGQAQQGREPSRACRHCGQNHYDNQCPQASQQGRLPISTTTLCRVCNEGAHVEKTCPRILPAEQYIPVYTQGLGTQRSIWTELDDHMTGLEEEEEGPRYLDVQEQHSRVELNPPFGSGVWDGNGPDPEILPDAPPLVEEYTPFNGSNYDSWQYYRHQEEATRQVRHQQELHQTRRPFVYSPPQPFATPFTDWSKFW